MFPNNLHAFIAFVAIILPGIAYNRVRDLRREPEDRSAFLELGEIVLAGFSATALAVWALVCILPNSHWQWTVTSYLDKRASPGAYIEHLVNASVLEVVIATAIAFAAAFAVSEVQGQPWRERFSMLRVRRQISCAHFSEPGALLTRRRNEVSNRYCDDVSCGDRSEQRHLAVEMSKLFDGGPLLQNSSPEKGDVTVLTVMTKNGDVLVGEFKRRDDTGPTQTLRDGWNRVALPVKDLRQLWVGRRPLKPLA